MRRILVILALLSVPLLVMLQVFQAYKYAVAGEELAGRTLELDRPKPEDVLLVKFADGTEIVP